MTYHRKPARTAGRRIRSTIFVTSVVVGAALVGAAAARIDMSPADPEATVISINASEPTTEVRDPPTIEDGDEPTSEVLDQPPIEAPGQHDDNDRRGRPQLPPLLGEADGVVSDGVTVTVFDDDVPTVANLDPDLLDAIRQAATDAADDGVEFSVTSGWRSPEYQEQLLQEAIVTYGSEAEAARWVASADTSLHVSGDAVDIGPAEAMAWLSEHGASYGLCQTYENEPWHFELRPDAIDVGCPPMYADPTHDPRMQR